MTLYCVYWKRANKTETTNERKESDLIGLWNGYNAPGAPNENIVQNHLRIALLNVF